MYLLFTIILLKIIVDLSDEVCFINTQFICTVTQPYRKNKLPKEVFIEYYYTK